MKIAYISLVDLASRSGAVDHVVGIARGLADLGHEVHLLAPAADQAAARVRAAGLVLHVVGGRSVPGRMASMARTAREVLRREAFDLVYLRVFPLDHWLLTRWLVAEGIPYVCELNTMTDQEYRAKGKARLGRLLARSEGRTLADARAWLPVTEEIRTWAERTAGLRRPAAIAMNGIALDDLAPARSRAEVREALGTPATAPVLVMSGFTSPWHGADRAIAMLPHLAPGTELWLIGAKGQAEHDRTTELARQAGVATRVRVFPWMARHEAAELVAAADLALGSLALDRNRMAEAQSIKVPFCLAMGLPLLLNYRDARLREALPFVAHVDGVDPRALAAAATTLLAGRHDPAGIRAYVEANLTWAAAARQAEDLLREVLRPREGAPAWRRAPGARAS